MIPKIINRPEAASTDVPEQMRPATSAPNAASARPEPPKSAVNPPSSSKGAERDDVPITIGLLSAVRSPTAGIVAFGGLALMLIAVFALARRRERGASTPARDLASVSLDRRRAEVVPRAGPAGTRNPATSIAPSRPAPPVPVEQPAAQRTPPAWVDRIPHTRAEALQMLGMGVSRDATEAAMKKIVDGLRLSWHPDLAKDEADRQLREFRVKQINAAWDLIQGKRLERLDS